MVCVAQFEERPPEPRPPLLTLVVDPRFVGSARADDLGLECGDQCSRAVAAGHAHDAHGHGRRGVDVRAMGGDADCADGEVTVAADMVCVAQLEERPPEPPPPLLTLVVDPRFVGTARADEVDLEYDDRCSRAVAAGTPATLTAAADDGSVFLHWAGDEDCRDGAIVMDADRTCVARFAALDRLVEVRLVVPARRMRVGRQFQAILRVRNLGREIADSHVRPRVSRHGRGRRRRGGAACVSIRGAEAAPPRAGVGLHPASGPQDRSGVPHTATPVRR
jgi:hypothetical protein